MSDDVLRRNLRAVDSAMRPNPVFVDDLHARLTAELGFEALPRPAAKVRVPARPQFRRGARLGWLAVAALLVLALLALLLAQVGRTPDEPPPPPTGSPSSQPSAPPSSQPTGASSPQGSTAPAIADSSPALDNLRSDGLVLYESGAMDGIPRLRVLRPDLSSVELLPDVPGLQFGAAWRPDGERLAFTSYDAVELRSHPLIWETDAEGVEPILLSEGCDLPTCVAEYEPSYSPDGTRLLFVRTRVQEGAEEESVVAIRDLETGAVTELNATSRPRLEAENLHPRWSPDGQTIAYGVSEYGESGFPGDSTLHLVDADGSQRADHQCPRAPRRGTGMVAGWRDDPVRIQSLPSEAESGGRAGRPASPGGHGRGWIERHAVRLWRACRRVAASWTASGEQILFTLMEGGGTGIQRPSNPRLFVMDPDGGNVLPLTRSPGTALYAVQQPSP